MGTESHICSWKGSLTDLFGEWIFSGEFEEEPGFQFENVGAAEAGALADEQDSNNLVFDVVPCEAAPVSQDFRESGVRIDFTHQVFIAGMLHITHNMSKSLAGVGLLEYFSASAIACLQASLSAMVMQEIHPDMFG